jgi:hypothetical protein
MKLLITITIALLVISCRSDETFDFVGKWQSLNAQGGIEINDQLQIDLFIDGLPFWSLAAKHPPLKFEVISQKGNWLSFHVMDGEELFMKGKIERVSKDRVRFYFFKHHDILDIADEYHRANDFNSYTSIMEDILKQPE